MVNTFPGLSDSTISNANSTTSNIVDCEKNIDCNACNKPLGKKHSVCEYCDKHVHTRCIKASQYGCKKCRSNMFPSCTNLFDNQINDHIFNPFDNDSLINNINKLDDALNDESTESLSNNLKKCRYMYLNDFGDNQKDSLYALSLNIRSLHSNFHKLKDEEHKLQAIDIICLSETNLNPDNILDPSLYSLEGFHTPIFQGPIRDSSKGGGLAIYINKSKFDAASFAILDTLSEASTIEKGEFLFLEIDTGPKSKNIIIGNFYRSPAHKPAEFIDHYNMILDSLKKHSNKHILLMGDANIDYLKYDTCPHAKDLFNVVSQHGLIPVISRPTRITEHTMTLIDHIYTNAIMNFKSSGVIMDPFADHLGIFIKIEVHLQKIKPPETY